MRLSEHIRPLRALLFDVDGTLADTEGEGHLPAFNAAFAEHGVPWRWEAERYRTLLRQVPGGRERLLYELQQRSATFQPPEPVADFARRLHQAKNRHYAQRLEQGLIPPRPGVQRLIREAMAGGVRLAVVTTSAHENVEALFHHVLGTDLRPHFGVIVAGDDVPRKKPAPDAYRLALQHLGLPAETCLALEDSTNGLQAALAAGLPTLITRNEWTRDDDFSGALAVVEHLDDDGQGNRVTIA